MSGWSWTGEEKESNRKTAGAYMICPLSSRQVKYLKRGADERPHFVAVFLCTPFFFIFFDSLVFRNRVFFWMFSSDCLIPYF